MSDDIDLTEEHYIWWATVFMSMLFSQAMDSLGLGGLATVCVIVVYVSILFEMLTI